MAGFDLAALERRIAALEANRGASLRFGIVTEVNEKDGSARVQLEDGDKMVTHPLRVLSDRVLKDKRQTMPDLQEPVAVLFAGQGMEQGVVLGGTYTKKTPSPGKPAGHDYIVYEDGTELWYDREAHKLIAKVKGDAEIETDGHATLAAKKEISAASDVSITLTAPFVYIKGLLRVTDKDGKAGQGELLGTYAVKEGDFHVPDGDSTAGTVSLLNHTHKNVQPGRDSSGIPNTGSAGGSGDFPGGS